MFFIFSVFFYRPLCSTHRSSHCRTILWHIWSKVGFLQIMLPQMVWTCCIHIPVARNCYRLGYNILIRILLRFLLGPPCAACHICICVCMYTLCICRTCNAHAALYMYAKTYNVYMVAGRRATDMTIHIDIYDIWYIRQYRLEKCMCMAIAYMALHIYIDNVCVVYMYACISVYVCNLCNCNCHIHTSALYM